MKVYDVYNVYDESKNLVIVPSLMCGSPSGGSRILSQEDSVGLICLTVSVL